MRYGLVVGWLMVCLLGESSRVASAYEYVFSSFSGAGFDYTFSGFQQSIGASEVRLFDPDNGAGGAGFSYPASGIDFSDFADSRLMVDYTVGQSALAEPVAARWFELELFDVHGNTGKWRFDMQAAPVGAPIQGIALNNLASPESGNNYQALDLSAIRRLQVLGDFNATIGGTGVTGFDVLLDRIWIQNALPAPPAYSGAEPDAPWRATAEARIDALRKADLVVNVRDAHGQPAIGADVAIAMQRHEFGFGSAAATPWINETNSDGQQYREKFAELFNRAITENALKWQGWAGDWGNTTWSQANTLAALDWLNEQGIPVHGHNLLWPGEDKIPDAVEALLQSTINTGQPLDPAGQAALRAIISAHIADISSKTAGKLASWDAVNEPRQQQLFFQALDEGEAAMADWYQEIRSANPGVRLFLNENRVIDAGLGIDTPQQQALEDHITLLQQAGAPLDAIGLQAHYYKQDENQDLIGPEDLWAVLDRFAAFGLPMAITEFDFDTDDEQLQANYTRDFLTAAFAHEGLDTVFLWGFWEGRTPRPDAALYRQDWSIKPNGQAYRDLVFDQWWTEEQLLADQQGQSTTRGFKGEYLVTVTHAGKQRTMAANLSDGGLVLDITIPFHPADFNADGVVDAADYAVWRKALSNQDPIADANNDGKVDNEDLTIWKANYGAILEAPEPATSQATPEPLGAVLFLIATLRAVASRDRNR